MTTATRKYDDRQPCANAIRTGYECICSIADLATPYNIISYTCIQTNVREAMDIMGRGGDENVQQLRCACRMGSLMR